MCTKWRWEMPLYWRNTVSRMSFEWQQKERWLWPVRLSHGRHAQNIWKMELHRREQKQKQLESPGNGVRQPERINYLRQKGVQPVETRDPKQCREDTRCGIVFSWIVNDLKQWNASNRIGDCFNILNAEKKHNDENQSRLLSERIRAGFGPQIQWRQNRQ